MKSSHSPSARALPVISRVAASLVGGWIFVWGFATLSIAALLAAGLSYGDARTLVYLLAFLVFLVVLCWSFATASVLRVWLALAGGGAAMTALCWFVLRSSPV
ncbi:MAG: iron uptake protein [Burkholderiaceae bacterium]|nr:iron uptake protein [Burkholderiaceae bacterium]